MVYFSVSSIIYNVMYLQGLRLFQPCVRSARVFGGAGPSTEIMFDLHSPMIPPMVGKRRARESTQPFLRSPCHNWSQHDTHINRRAISKRRLHSLNTHWSPGEFRTAQNPPREPSTFQFLGHAFGLGFRGHRVAGT